MPKLGKGGNKIAYWIKPSCINLINAAWNNGKGINEMGAMGQILIILFSQKKKKFIKHKLYNE
jgi:hypothetical protein